MTEYQWQCLVRQVLQWTAKQPKKASEFMNIVYDKAPERWKKLKADCRTQWDRGNKGEWGRWE